jgi:hypothetical protein
MEHVDFSTSKIGPKTGYSWSIMDGEAMISIFKLNNRELSENGQYLVLYEDAHCDVNTKLYTLEEISLYYMINLDELKENLL